MILRRPSPSEGVCFAWKWKHTPDGVVWLEHVRFRHTDDGWRYERIKYSLVPVFPNGKLLIILDGEGPSGKFVEIEDVNGFSHAAGTYKARADGLTALEIDLAHELSRQAPLTR